MSLPASLLALVLLVLCGGIEPAWAAEHRDDATECPVAPEGPTEAESEGEGEEAVCAEPTDARPGVQRALSGSKTEWRSAEASVELRPPRG